MRRSILAMILAGGEGTRLAPLTTQRAKPAVPFGGKYRIIDFVLSNFINSGIESIFVLTQFRSQSLNEHLQATYNFGRISDGKFVTPVPAQMQNEEKKWYSGTADAIYQNIHLLNDYHPDLLAVFGGDHIYKMDVSQMAKFHVKQNALATIAAIPVPIAEGSRFGIIQVDEDGCIIGFQEKPENPTPMPDNPDYCLASMGNYVFDSKWISKALEEDANDPESTHDFGNDVLPKAVESGRLYAYNFNENTIPGQNNDKDNYWMDVGTIQAYYEANMDLKSATPQLDLYNPKWPVHCYQEPLPPAKFVHNETISHEGVPRIGKAINSTVCEGTILSGCTVNNSIISPRTRIHSYTTVSDSIVMSSVEIMENCAIRNAIIDKHVHLKAGTKIGYNRAEDEKNYTVVDLDTKAGTWLTIIEKNHDRVSGQLKAGYLNF